MKNIIRALKLIVPIHPLRLLIYLLLSLPGAVLPTVSLHLQRKLVDNAAGLNPDLPLSHYMEPVLLLIGTYMAMKLFGLLSRQYMEFGYFSYVFMGLDARIHAKSAKIPLEYYDNAEYYKMVQNAKRSSMFLVFTANLAVMTFLVTANLLSVSGYLFTLHPLLVLFVVLVSAPVIIEKLKTANRQAALMQDTAQAIRRKTYAFGLISQSSTKKELAHHGACHYVADKYLAACREINEKERQNIWQLGKSGFFFAGLKALFHGLSVFLMVYLLIAGNISIGGFSVLLTSFSTLTAAFTQLFSHTGEIMQTGVMSEAYFALMNLDIRDGTKELPDRQEYARLSHVSYRYPNANTFALQDISLSIKKGETIAIVGENGAGKTTLAKLLSGFLLPTDGTMELGGIPRGQLKENSIFEQISAVYQDFGRYKLTLAQNVCLSDTHSDKDPARIRAALDWADLPFSSRPEDVLLGREFGGTELSGGQWQRLALARSRYRQRPILFLDEPTSAIDPLEEMTLYEKLKELGSNRTNVLITHRLGAVRNADRIVVLDGGNIAEIGNFTELMARKGPFYRIWTEQAKWYQQGG